MGCQACACDFGDKEGETDVLGVNVSYV